MNKRQMMNTVEKLIDFCKSQLSRSLTQNERTYFESRLFTLKEWEQAASTLTEGSADE